MLGNDRRDELIERAYRRGYALRRRRRSTATVASLVVIAVAIGGAASLSSRHGARKVSVVQQQTTTTAVQPACASAVAVPAADVPPDVAAWAQDAPVIGTGSLWTTVAALHVAGTLDNHTYDVKFPWFTTPTGLPTINARRLDGPGTFHADVNYATDARGTWVISSLEFSAPGCWEVTARFQSSTLRFNLRISSAPSTVVFADQNDGLGLDFTCNVPTDANPVCQFDILSSNDAGRTWLRVGGMTGIVYDWRGYPDIELAASGANVWVFGTRSFESHDGGHTFQPAHFDGLVSALVPEGDTVWVASRACANCPTETLLSAPIRGGAWTKIDGFPNLDDPYAVLVRPSATVAYVVGRDTHAVLYRTDDAGHSWQSIAAPPSPPASPRTATVTLAALGSDQVWTLTGGTAPGRSQEKALYRSDDGGQHWTLVADTGAQRPGVGHLPQQGFGLDLAAVTPQQLWMPIEAGPLIGSLDGGQHWFATGITTTVAQTQIDFVDPLHGWAWNGSPSYRTTDGKDWVPIIG